ncbi:hypothetical protein [Aureivirga sp. CE67]|uniref:hypothetical protein n=1 Tax=Aureivirga sp. CE67 TaxID=1788983 RepID=UPI0018CAB445|nr:hypothetical protein [Aureivirga sp. CE67]
MGLFEDLEAINSNSKKYRVIKTARNIEEMNEAARNGFRPLVKKVEASEKIRSKYSIFQHIETGEIKNIVDAREGLKYQRDENYINVIERTFYYPYNFESPFAAYLVPKDIEVGELVFLEDLIEDLVGFEWNQGVTHRLISCEAKWNGESFEILYNPKKRIRIRG